MDVQIARILAELLLLQRWAGGEVIEAHRIFGLMHGFETYIRRERESVSEETQEAVEDILDAIDKGKSPAEWLHVKGELHRLGIDEYQARLVMRLCVLEGRFDDVVAKIAPAERKDRTPESNWLGSLHFIELVDTTDGVNKKMHAMFSPCVPRIGEIVEPENGSPMKVVDVSYAASRIAEFSPPVLIPCVYLAEE